MDAKEKGVTLASTLITVPATSTQTLETTPGWTIPTISPSPAPLHAGMGHHSFKAVMEIDDGLIQKKVRQL